MIFRRKTIATIVVALCISFIFFYQTFCFYTHTGKYKIDEIKIEIKTKHSIFYWQDVIYNKQIILTNSSTGNKVSIKYKSIEPSIYFYIANKPSNKSIIILDKFSGADEYTWDSLNFIGINKCLNIKKQCEGFREESLSMFGRPAIVYHPR